MEIDISRFDSALQTAIGELLAKRSEQGFWKGHLASSALATATAVSALELYYRACIDKNDKPPFDYSLIEKGLDWLAKNAGADGGWGDTVLSFSNLSTTVLCWSAFYIVKDGAKKHEGVVQNAEKWIKQRAGRIEPYILVPAIINRYGNDRTFSAPILMMCAIAGRLGDESECWSSVPQLPFELAALPAGFFAALKLPVVSYALPALVAIGQVRHKKLPSKNFFINFIRSALKNKTLELVNNIQPENGGFLEAIPLTSFVTMALVCAGEDQSPIVNRAIKFIVSSARADGSWAIDSDLATWLTTLSINALLGTTQSAKECPLSQNELLVLFKWLLNQQFKAKHPYTNSPPGGWAWTNLPGGVPDADDTAGALLALSRLMPKISDSPKNLSNRSNERQFQHGLDNINPIKSATAGINWLIGLQNKDGGIPTFCRGWGHLQFDSSGADLTSHALRAISAYLPFLPPQDGNRLLERMKKAVEFLFAAQSSEGYWQPLWFGNQYERYERNLIYGTSRVLLALQQMLRIDGEKATSAAEKAVNFLINSQNSDGSWGGFKNSPPSIEETALAVESLGRVYFVPFCEQELREKIVRSCIAGANWLIEKVYSGEWKKPSPIGFYFARLWYYEELYPIIFTVAALNSVSPLLKSKK
ncbi:MAG: prenyltransferase/squalene oxidase repeat-containing protein [Verrucomicrobiia bacterium]